MDNELGKYIIFLLYFGVKNIMHNHFVTIIGLGALTSCQSPTKVVKKEQKTTQTVTESTKTTDGTKQDQDTSNTKTQTKTISKDTDFSKGCPKDYDVHASCAPDGITCPRPESQKGDSCPPPENYSCEDGRWQEGPMPPCNPPIMRPPPSPPKK